MNKIACLIKEPTKAAKLAVIDISDQKSVRKIIGSENVEFNAWNNKAAIIYGDPHRDESIYNCSIQGGHYYGTIIITGVRFDLCSIDMTPEFIQEFIPAEDKYEEETWEF